MQKQAIPYRENGFVQNPHVVLLGAGASLAAAPQGDKNGRKIPLMKDLPEILGLNALLGAAGYAIPVVDFEDAFTKICKDENQIELRIIIEEKVYKYFSSLEIPDCPTVYDYLAISMREKDVLATFNWDPFLVQAMIRNNAINNGPTLLFLHGNVMVGHCIPHKKFGYPYERCSVCSEPFTPSKLLYPVGEKNYAENEFISNQWELLKLHLKHAYGFTIFGYSGPKTDQEARRMMREQWCSSSLYQQSQLEIIDVVDREALEANWKDIIYSHHYHIMQDWKHALFFKHPRRSTEALFDALLQCNPRREQPFPNASKLSDMQQHVAPLREEEILGVRSTGT